MFTISNIETIRSTAQEFVRAMNGRTVFAFYGEMGAGKTTFIKAICEELGVTDVINSPTFAIVNEYSSPIARGNIYHFDFYRIKDIREALDFGAEEYLYSGAICFIEWPERVEQILPDDVVEVHITVEDDGRRTVRML